MLAAVVGAEQELAGVKNHAHERLSTAAIAAVCIGQWFHRHCTHIVIEPRFPILSAIKTSPSATGVAPTRAPIHGDTRKYPTLIPNCCESRPPMSGPPTKVVTRGHDPSTELYRPPS